MTKLWLIRQTKNKGYDTYDSAVVAAPDAVIAKHTHPDECRKFDPTKDSWNEIFGSSWVHPRDVVVEYLGETDREIFGVIVASFNAG